jgi:hypothetical protein
MIFKHWRALSLDRSRDEKSADMQVDTVATGGRSEHRIYRSEHRPGVLCLP